MCRVRSYSTLIVREQARLAPRTQTGSFALRISSETSTDSLEAEARVRLGLTFQGNEPKLERGI
jgi:hypothetical protein